MNLLFFNISFKKGWGNEVHYFNFLMKLKIIRPIIHDNMKIML